VGTGAGYFPLQESERARYARAPAGVPDVQPDEGIAWKDVLADAVAHARSPKERGDS
jgi:hypothetical protein